MSNSGSRLDHSAMSAQCPGQPPKADVDPRSCDVAKVPEADIGHLAYPRGAMVFEREYRMAQMSRFGWSISRPAEFIGLNAQRCIVN
jgi:hypothetical protein